MVGESVASIIASPATQRRWSLADVIDFEHLAARPTDPPGADEALRHAAKVRSDDRNVVFLAWLDAMRLHGARPLPGASYERGRRVLRLLVAIVGLVAGAGLVGALLARSEIEPINALLFFGATVGVQLAFLLALVIAWMLRRLHVQIRPLQDLWLASLGAIARWSSRGMQALDGERRTALHAWHATFDVRSERLAPLVGCDVLIVAQSFAVAFNLGLLGAMLFVYLPFVELRFGWQSTYSFTAAGVDAWARLVASPWSWLGGSLIPTPEQVAATQFTRGQSAATLSAAAARAWWPFLIMAIAVYGLAIRLLIMAACAAVLRHRLGRLQFVSPQANALWRRLRGAFVATTPSLDLLPDRVDLHVGAPIARIDLLVVDTELAAVIESVRARVSALLAAPVDRLATAEVDDDRLPAELVAALRNAHSGIVIAIAAHRDPIVAIAGFLRAIRAALGDPAELTIALVGSLGSDASPSVDDGRLTIWRRFVTIQRLAIRVERA